MLKRRHHAPCITSHTVEGWVYNEKSEIISGSGESPAALICLASLTGNALYQILESYFSTRSVSTLQCCHLDYVSQLCLWECWGEGGGRGGDRSVLEKPCSSQPMSHQQQSQLLDSLSWNEAALIRFLLDIFTWIGSYQCIICLVVINYLSTVAFLYHSGYWSLVELFNFCSVNSFPFFTSGSSIIFRDSSPAPVSIWDVILLRLTASSPSLLGLS